MASAKAPACPCVGPVVEIVSSEVETQLQRSEITRQREPSAHRRLASLPAIVGYPRRVVRWDGAAHMWCRLVYLRCYGTSGDAGVGSRFDAGWLYPKFLDSHPDGNVVSDRHFGTNTDCRAHSDNSLLANAFSHGNAYTDIRT